MSTILALDIGTEFVKTALARTTKKGNLEVIGLGRAKQPQGAMYNGAITDIPAVTGAAEAAVFEAEEESGETASLAVVGIAGELVKGTTTTVNYTRDNPNKPITEDEIEKIIQAVQKKTGEVAKREIALETGNDDTEIRLINSAIVSITIDGYRIMNPIGFKGTKVVFQFYTAFAPLIHVAAIEKVCAELSLELLSVAVEPFAVCRACLGDENNTDFSGIVIDIGGGTTDLAVVSDGGVMGTKMFSVGGRSFTHQIAEILGVDFNTAEKVKISLDDDSKNPAEKARALRAVENNLKIWLSGVEIALSEFDPEDTLPKNILLCGGGAGLSKLQETLATSDWYKNLPFSRRPTILLIETASLPDLVFKTKTRPDYSFTTALGLLRVGVDTLAGSPEDHSLKARLDRLLQK